MWFLSIERTREIPRPCEGYNLKIRRRNHLPRLAALTTHSGNCESAKRRPLGVCALRPGCRFELRGGRQIHAMMQSGADPLTATLAREHLGGWRKRHLSIAVPPKFERPKATTTQPEPYFQTLLRGETIAVVVESPHRNIRFREPRGQGSSRSEHGLT